MAEWSPVGGTLMASVKGQPWREEAACWLLAESGAGISHWPERLDEAGFISWEEQEDADWDFASIRWDALAQELTRQGSIEGMHGTGAEWCVLRFAVSLMTGKGGNWGTDLSRLDHQNRQLLHGALAWAMGGEQAAASYILDATSPA